VGHRRPTTDNLTFSAPTMRMPRSYRRAGQRLLTSRSRQAPDLELFCLIDTPDTDSMAFRRHILALSGPSPIRMCCCILRCRKPKRRDGGFFMPLWSASTANPLALLNKCDRLDEGS
jgi:hypothetical protein